MKRKVIKQGNNTLTLTLPRKWTDKLNIKAGEELDVIEKDKSLVVGGHKDTREQKISADISNLDRTAILTLIQGFYRYGYDYIEISTKNPSVQHYRNDKKVSVSSIVYDTTNRMIGAEIISASQNRYVIKRLTEESIEDFPTALRRIFLLLNEMFETFVSGVDADNKSNKNEGNKGISESKELLESIEFQHTNIKKFINFCLRLLNKYGYDDTRKTCFYFHIISLLSKIEDIIKNHARYILKHGLRLKEPYFFELLKYIQTSSRMYYELFYSYDLNKTSQLNKHRDMFRSKLFSAEKKLSKEESIIIGGLSQIIELILDMSETRMAMDG